MIAALVSTAAMSVGGVAAVIGQGAIVPFLAFAVALGVLVLAQRAELAVPARVARALVALAVIAAVAGRHVFVSSSAVAPDDLLAAIVVVGAFALPRGKRWGMLGAAVVLATYAVIGATLITFKPYHSDAVVSAHGAADALLAGRNPYDGFDLHAQLARFGLPPEFATRLEDGSRVRSLQYPALAFLLPAPLVALGLTDLRAIYLVEVLAIFGIAVAAARPGTRALVLAACVGNVVILGQFVLAGVDPLVALLLLGAWLLRGRRGSAVLLGLAIASRQQAWLVAPFLIVSAWHASGAREALARALVAAGVAALVHLPFLATAPGAVIGGLLDSALEPQEVWGIGPSKLLADAGLAAHVPRGLYLALAGGAYIGALALYAARRPTPGPLVAPLLPLWFGWRALQNYFAFLPIFALASDRSEDRIDARSGSPGARPRLTPRSARPGDRIP
jgi:hypothetical protein